MRTFRQAALVAVVTLGAFGCGQGDGEGDTTTVVSSTTTAVSEPTTSTSVSSSTTRSGTTATTAAAAANCGSVGFTPNSEDAAGQITARGLTCAEALALVRAAGPRTSAGGPPQLNVEGYRCVLTRTVQDPLPYASYECTNGAKRVTFDRS